MKEKDKKEEKESLERLELENKPMLFIKVEVLDKIKFLQSKCKGKEWSGELITREEGTINDLNDWKIIAEDIYLVDVGTSGFTEYQVDKGSFKSADIIELYNTFPGLMDGTQKCHHIHDHHTMGKFIW